MTQKRSHMTKLITLGNRLVLSNNQICASSSLFVFTDNLGNTYYIGAMGQDTEYQWWVKDNGDIYINTNETDAFFVSMLAVSLINT